MTIQAPNYTQVPNAILDRMHEMTPAEVVVLMAICRQTFGWHKSEDVMTLSQLVRMTGMSKPTVLAGVNAAERHELLERTNLTEQSQSYRLLVTSDYQQPVKNLDRSNNFTGNQTLPDAVKELDRSPVKNLDQHLLKKDLKKSKEISSSISPPAPVLRLIPGGLRGGGGEEEKEIDDEGETDEGTAALVDECELESDERRKAELVDQLVALRLWRSSAVEAVATGTVSTNHDIVCCKRFCESSRLENPAGSLWSNWLSTGQVPPIPQLSDTDPSVIDAARRLSADLDRQRDQGGLMIDQRALAALKARQARPVLKSMPPAVDAATYWRST